jgi:ABC-type antimicrobial peptide transport system permease subunit
MKFLGQIKFVIAGFLARKGRSFLTILGIMIGVAGVIIIIALGAGAQSLVLGQITKLGTNLIGVLPGKSDSTGPPAQAFGVLITTLTNEDVKAISDKSRAPHIAAAAGYVNGSATVVYNNQNVDTTFTGTQASYPDIQNTPMESGQFFDKGEEQSGNVIVLGYDVKQELFGDNDALGKIVKVKNVPMQVVGVAAKQGTVAFQNQDDQVFIPLGIAQDQLLGIKYVHFVRAKVDAPENVKESIDEVDQILRDQHHIKLGAEDDFTVRDLADAIKVLTSITDALRLFLVAMAAISLVVGGIGIMNIMLVTVAERTREIGLRKAVGATNAAIRNQFLLESGLITMFGGMIGIIIGVLISYLISVGARLAGYDWAFSISFWSVILAVGVSMLTGIIFGLYPAYKASKLNPIEALRYE